MEVGCNPFCAGVDEKAGLERISGWRLIPGQGGTRTVAGVCTQTPVHPQTFDPLLGCICF